MFDVLLNLVGFLALTWQNVVMICIGACFITLGIKFHMEPLLLVPIGFSAIIVNLPLSGITSVPHGFLYLVYKYLIKTEVIPLLIFLGVGAMTDFEPLLADPKTFLLGAAAQIGIYCAMLTALVIGFNLNQAAAIGIIGGADGPTTIYTSTKLAPDILGAVAVAAYSYMSLVPIIQPPVIKALTTKKERSVVMEPLRKVSKKEKILFPIITTIVVGLLVPPALPLVGMLMFGNLLRECGVTERLSNTAQNDLINIATIFLGLGVGFMMTADKFLTLQTVEILMLGILAFATATAGGVLLGKLMYVLSHGKINPMIGAAGVSAVPMSARVVQKMGVKENPENFLLMHAMGPNVAGVIGSAVAAGVFIAYIL
ncbi:MAG: sodium ion-translocating decarboxylase subunit beta [Euryarchaeota archaeon]|nr:sodium ion-translocating decarboxylase subunit beta [Euryarchaeota archaeon]